MCSPGLSVTPRRFTFIFNLCEFLLGGKLIELFGVGVSGGNKGRQYSSSGGAELIAMRSWDFVNQTMFVIQPQQVSNLPRLSAAFLVRAITGTVGRRTTDRIDCGAGFDFRQLQARAKLPQQRGHDFDTAEHRRNDRPADSSGHQASTGNHLNLRFLFSRDPTGSAFRTASPRYAVPSIDTLYYADQSRRSLNLHG